MPGAGAGESAVVTGGAGAIGSVLVRALLGRGRSVTAVDNFSSGKPENLREAHENPRFRLVRADLLEPDGFRDAMRGASEVWHLAANPDIRRGTEDPRLDFDQGARATFHVLEAARRADAERVFFSSSSVVYGYPSVFPTPEDYGPLLPESQYGAAKLAAEGLVSAFCHSYGFRGVLFRFANIVGPGMTHGVLYDFFRKLAGDPSRLEVLGDGNQAKSYLRVEDCVDGMLVAAERSKDPVGVYNLGTRDRISVREIAAKVVAATGGRARIEYTGGERGWVGDIPQQLLAVDRIEALGWRARLNSAQAVDRTIPEMRAEVLG
jgi:UDP-glucose 4-epimerase